jgi:hypothetical protein
MARTLSLLLQTTIPSIVDDWHIDRFSLLQEYLDSLRHADGTRRYEVIARNRHQGPDGNDPVLSRLGDSDFDELWLFAVDTGDGLSAGDCAGISAFNARGGGILSTRDHEDLGSSLCTLGRIGAAHHFHSVNPEPDENRRRIDDTFSPHITWPNYHSGANGDYQRIDPVDPLHDLLRSDDSPTGTIELLPSHPHEGAVDVPAGQTGGFVIARGRSSLTGIPFNIAVAFERGPGGEGRGVADSSFHHFVDYNWDTALGAPSFVTEPSGESFMSEPRALADTLAYVRNIAAWLAPAA